MRNDIAEPSNWKYSIERKYLHDARFQASSGTKACENLTLDAVDAAFEEVTLGSDGESSLSPAISTERGNASELVQSLELQLVHLEAQCQQLRRLLDQSCK